MSHSLTASAAVAAVLAATSAVLAYPLASPDDPSAVVPPVHYDSVTAGTRSYRPVAPLPWGDVNRRVAPRGALPPPAAPDSSAPSAASPSPGSGSNSGKHSH